MDEGVELSPIDIYGSKKEREITTEFLSDYLIKQSITREDGSIRESPPEAFYHIWEVECVAVNIAKQANILDKSERKVAEDKATFLAKLHDLGRIDDIQDMESGRYKSNNHPKRGAKRARELGFEQKYVDFAILHHRWGLGVPVMGKESIYLYISRYGIQAGIDYYNFIYGLPGLAVLIADLSKSYTDPKNRFMPVIEKLTPQLAENLIQNQLNKKVFEEDSPRHKAELLGKQFLLSAINFISLEYGVDYDQAILAAKQEWGSYKADLEQRWRSSIDQRSQPKDIASPQAA